MVLWAVVGDLGSGKTLFTVELAKIFHMHIPVLANFKLKFPNCYVINPLDLLNLKFQKALMILDEAYSWLESRLSSSKINLYCDYIILQSRKRGLDIVVTAQLISTIDLRFRNLYDILVLCNKTNKGFNYIIAKRSLFGFKIANMFMPYDKAATLYDKYDTLEIIPPLGMENLIEDVSILTDPKKANETINGIVEEAKKQLTVITHATVSDFMLQKGYSQNLEPYVYARLKQQQQ